MPHLKQSNIGKYKTITSFGDKKPPKTGKSGNVLPTDKKKINREVVAWCWCKEWGMPGPIFGFPLLGWPALKDCKTSVSKALFKMFSNISRHIR